VDGDDASPTEEKSHTNDESPNDKSEKHSPNEDYVPSPAHDDGSETASTYRLRSRIVNGNNSQLREVTMHQQSQITLDFNSRNMTNDNIWQHMTSNNSKDDVSPAALLLNFSNNNCNKIKQAYPKVVVAQWLSCVQENDEMNHDDDSVDVEASNVEEVTHDSLAVVDVDVVVNKDDTLINNLYVTKWTNDDVKVHKNVTMRKQQNSKKDHINKEKEAKGKNKLLPPGTVVYDTSSNLCLLSPLSNQYPHLVNSTPKSYPLIPSNRKQPKRTCKLLDKTGKPSKQQVPRKLNSKGSFCFW
jgi:hypothetical protein